MMITLAAITTAIVATVLIYAIIKKLKPQKVSINNNSNNRRI